MEEINLHPCILEVKKTFARDNDLSNSENIEKLLEELKVTLEL